MIPESTQLVGILEFVKDNQMNPVVMKALKKVVSKFYNSRQKERYQKREVDIVPEVGQPIVELPVEQVFDIK